MEIWQEPGPPSRAADECIGNESPVACRAARAVASAAFNHQVLALEVCGRGFD
jgi:hypothetical protein